MLARMRNKIRKWRRRSAGGHEKASERKKRIWGFGCEDHHNGLHCSTNLHISLRISRKPSIATLMIHRPRDDDLILVKPRHSSLLGPPRPICYRVWIHPHEAFFHFLNFGPASSSIHHTTLYDQKRSSLAILAITGACDRSYMESRPRIRTRSWPGSTNTASGCTSGHLV